MQASQDRLGNDNLPNIPGLKAAIYRGSSARGFAWARTVGIPMDTDTLDRLNRHWPLVMAAMFGDVQREFPIFLPGSSDIAPTLWKEFLRRRDLLKDWPMTKGGRGKSSAKPQPKRDEKTLSAMADSYPIFHTDNLSWVRGSHNLKFGFGYIHNLIAQSYVLAAPTYWAYDGIFSGNSIADFLLGLAYDNSTFLYGGKGYTYQNQFHLYAQDQWHATRRLTLSYGLRYQLHSRGPILAAGRVILTTRPGRSQLPHMPPL